MILPKITSRAFLFRKIDFVMSTASYSTGMSEQKELLTTKRQGAYTVNLNRPYARSRRHSAPAEFARGFFQAAAPPRAHRQGDLGLCTDLHDAIYGKAPRESRGAARLMLPRVPRLSRGSRLKRGDRTTSSSLPTHRPRAKSFRKGHQRGPRRMGKSRFQPRPAATDEIVLHCAMCEQENATNSPSASSGTN